MAGRYTVEGVFKAVDRFTAPVRRMQDRMKRFMVDSTNKNGVGRGMRLASGISALVLASAGIFIGATLTREMRNAMLLSVAVYALALGLLIPAFGNHGLWAALMVLNATRGLTMARFYPRAEAKAAG